MRRNSLVSLLSIVGIAVLAFASTFVFDKQPTLGLDLQGGASVVLTPVGDYTGEALEQAKQIIRNRVDGLGVGEPEITRQGNAIVVALPGVKDQNRALDVVGQTAELRFRPVLEILPADENQAIPQLAPTTVDPAATTTAAADGATTTAAAEGATTTEAATPGKSARTRSAATTTSAASGTTTGTTTAGATTTTTAAAGATTTALAEPTTTSPVVTVTETIPSTKPEEDAADAIVILPEKDENGKVVARYRLGPTFLTGAGVSTARTDFTNEYVVSLELKGGATGIDLFNAMAATCYSGQSTQCPPIDSQGRGAIAIVLDSVVQSAPRINSASFQADQISITGNFKQKEADELSLVLRYGALPVKLEPQAVQTVSATLGKDSLRAGVFAGLVGVALVLIFMLFYYKGLALVVVGGLFVSGAILWSIISWWNATLTLSGATGIIVSIGVTVDSYVVFFERLKDDVRGGRTLRSSANRGFASAWRTIVAADLVSLLGAGVLYWLTVGSVRGFAFFLGLSTLIDLVVAYFFTRPAVRLLSISRFFQGDMVLGVRAGEAVAGGAA